MFFGRVICRHTQIVSLILAWFLDRKMPNHGQISLASNYTGIFRNAQAFLHATWLIPCLWFREFSIFVQKSYTFCHLVHQKFDSFYSFFTFWQWHLIPLCGFFTSTDAGIEAEVISFRLEEPGVPVEVHYVTFHRLFIEMVPEGENQECHSWKLLS